MTESQEARLMRFLDGALDEAERNEVLAELDADPALAEALREAAQGLWSMEPLASPGIAPGSATPPTRAQGVSPWWAVAASIATLAISIPATRALTSAAPATSTPVATLSNEPVQLGIPTPNGPSFVLVLHGVWPDESTLPAGEAARRQAQYWDWTSELATEGHLVAAGDLRWEPGRRLVAQRTAAGTPAAGDASTVGDPSAVDDPNFVVGMFTIRAESYEAAVALARRCPHLEYGGSVSVRQVGDGFVTVPGMGDWSD